MKAGFVGFGEINSPKQLIDDKCRIAGDEIRSLGIELVTTPTVTDDLQGQDVKRALSDLKKDDFDLLIICLAGWIPSHAVISIANEFKHKPMILWGLAGNVENGRIVTAAAQAGTTALRKVFEDLGYRFKYVYNIIGEPSPLDKINSFALAASAAKSLENTKVGMMGFRDMKLYNTLYEGLSLKSQLGIEVEFFEMLEMLQLSEHIKQQEVDDLLHKIKQEWTFVKPAEDDFLEKGIRYYLAIKKIAEDNAFDAISLKDVDGMKRILNFPPALIFMLLSDEMKLCTIPENDVMGAVTQLVVKHITSQCAAYFEFYEFFEKSVLVGVPDFVPAEVVNGKVKVTRAAFGGISGGLLNISEVKTGQLTIARLSNSGSQYTMHISTGEGKLRSWEEAGWDSPAPQLPSLEIFLDNPVEDFTQKISGQHYIIAYGNHLKALTDFCYLKNIKVIQGTNMKKYDAVIAGYVCVDLIPEFKNNHTHGCLTDILKPGKLIEINGLGATLGGVVANTGMSMKKFSKRVFLNGLIGDDFIGKFARESLDLHSLSEGIITMKGTGTAFGLVIAPPGVDRIFLESPGCSEFFDLSYINFEAIAQCRLFHFGYPPLLKQFYLDNGSQLINMLRTIQSMDVITSLDFSLPDMESESGNIDWLELLKGVLPYTDIFVPSLEEGLQMMMPEEYARLQSAVDSIDFIDSVPLDLIRELGRRIIECGVKVALIKSAHRGAYLWTGDISSINKKAQFNLSAEKWNHCELWCNAYPVNEDKVKNASGAGDTSAAAFLTALLNGETPETSLQYATLAGRNNLYCYDIYNELAGWADMTAEIEGGSHEIINLGHLKGKEILNQQ